MLEVNNSWIHPSEFHLKPKCTNPEALQSPLTAPHMLIGSSVGFCIAALCSSVLVTIICYRDAVYDRDSLLTFHKELQETCVDVMARYAFSTHASVPKRSVIGCVV